MGFGVCLYRKHKTKLHGMRYGDIAEKKFTLSVPSNHNLTSQNTHNIKIDGFCVVFDRFRRVYVHTN